MTPCGRGLPRSCVLSQTRACHSTQLVSPGKPVPEAQMVLVTNTCWSLEFRESQRTEASLLSPRRARSRDGPDAMTLPQTSATSRLSSRPLNTAIPKRDAGLF